MLRRYAVAAVGPPCIPTPDVLLGAEPRCEAALGRPCRSRPHMTKARRELAALNPSQAVLIEVLDAPRWGVDDRRNPREFGEVRW